MAFFDSPKNKAIWNKEMESLRPERAQRESEGFPPAKKRAEQQRAKLDIPGRKQINLEELQKIASLEQGGGEKKAVSAQRARAKEALAKSRGEKAKAAPTMEPLEKQAPQIEGAVRVPRPKRPPVE